MDFKTAKKAVDLAVSLNEKYVPLVFFGGEPLILKDLIYEVVEYTKEIKKCKDRIFSFKLVTNGRLLDDEFIEYSKAEGIFIAISLDGNVKAHNCNRVDLNGKGSYEVITPKVKSLLSCFPYTPVMQVVNPNTVQLFSDSVGHLFDLGFRFVVSTINYSGEWDEARLKILKKQYIQLSNLYYLKTMKEDKFYFSPFDSKINLFINCEDNCKADCSLGNEQISISPDGYIYPCTQFVGDESYIIGHVENGIDAKMKDEINKIGTAEKTICSECVLKNRCISYCSCLNKQTTGRIDTVSPVLCEHERILIPIADKLAEKLYKKKNGMFIQKHYNSMYPVISIIEDKICKSKKA